MTTVVLVRHGQASWGKRDYDRLSPLGARQAEATGVELAAREVSPTVLCSGTMRRQRDSATALSEAARWRAMGAASEGWNEYDHMAVITGHRPAYRSLTVMKADLVRAGRGRPYRAFDEMYAAAIDRWVVGDGSYPERYTDFCERVDETLDAAVDGAGHDGTVVAVTSAGVIARVVTRAVDGTSDSWVRIERTLTNASITTLNVGARGIHLVTFNEHRHLQVEPGLLTTR